MTNPFKSAAAVAPRLKLLVWGPVGSGKTRLALNFPGAAVIDLEKGTVPYGGRYSFDVLPASSLADVDAAINYLAAGAHDYKTLVIDPITVWDEMLKAHWSAIFLNRNKQGRGFKFEFYEMQVRDYQTLKASLKERINRLVALDMNIVCCAREKPLYADGTGVDLKKIGVTHDGDRSLPAFFDTVIQLEIQGGKRMAIVHKDRSERLPASFVLDYAVFEAAFGDALARPGHAVTLPPMDDDDTAKQRQRISDLIAALGLSDEAVTRSLRKYGVTSVASLTPDAATAILSKLEEQYQRQNNQAA